MKSERRNENHNLKSSQELLLIDKQGLLLLTPSNKRDPKPIRKKFAQIHELFELAVVFGIFINNYSDLRTRQEDLADFFLSKIQHWIDEPDIIFVRSVTNSHIWRLLIKEFALKSTLRAIMKPAIVKALEEKSQYFDHFSSSWWNEKDLPSLLSRKITESRELDLQFLDDDELKTLIFADYAEAKRSLNGRNYKATVLLCGSIAEAIFTAIIAKANLPGLTTEKLYKLHFYELIEKAETHGLLTDTGLFKLLHAIREYRNLIHPGATIRKSINLDSNLATIALAVIGRLVKDISRSRHP